jgi:hypothetical protein
MAWIKSFGRGAAIAWFAMIGSSFWLRAQQNPPAGAVKVEMNNVNYHFQESIAVHIARLSGALIPAQQGKPPVFDDKRSFTLAIDSAEIAITQENLTNLLNDYVFAEKDSPLKKIKAEFQGSQISITGTLHKGVDIAFETLGTIEAKEGLIRIHPKKIKAAHVPAKGLMELFGVEVADLLNTKNTRGVRVQDDDFILYPDKILPPPRIAARLSSVAIQGKQLVQKFGSQMKPTAPAFSGNYMAYRGNVLRFGKLTMDDADLVLIDQDPRDPFDFALDHYKEQLTAGYSKTIASGGLRTYMPDFNKLRKPAAKGKTH